MDPEKMVFTSEVEEVYCGLLVLVLNDLRLLRQLFTILLMSTMNVYEDRHVLLEHVLSRRT